MIFKFIILLLLAVCLNAQTYTLYISSTKYNDVAKKYYFNLKKIFPKEDLLIRTHVKPNFSLIIRNIKNIEKAKELQNILSTMTTYKDSYIKRYDSEPNYDIVKVDDIIEEEIVIDEKELPLEEYTHTIEDSNDYITASTMYNIQNYSKSYELFYKIFLKNNYNVNVNYYLALSAIKIKKFDEASAAFERVLIEKPDFNQARYEYAKLLYNLKLKDEAKKEFNKLSKADITEDTKKLVKKYLDILNIKPKYSNINATILVGAGRSSNVNNGLISHEYRLPGLNDISVSGEKPIADNFHNEMLAINFINSFKNHKEYKVKNSFMVYNKSYLNESDQNLTVYSYKPSFSYFDKSSKFLYDLALGFTRISKKNNDSFNSINLMPSLTSSLYYTALNYQRILYLSEDNKSKNFEKYEFIFKYNLLSKLNLFTKITKNIRLDKTRIDLDKDTYSGGLDYTYLLNNKNTLKLGLEYIYSKYKYMNDFFESKREDDNYFISLSYLNKIDKSSQVILSSSYTKNQSNQEAYTYEELEGKLNYIKSFNW